MTDAHDTLLRLAAGRFSGPLIRALGLPSPRPLRREAGGYRSDELAGRAVAWGTLPGGHAGDAARAALQALGASLKPGPVWSTQERIELAVLDATGCCDVAALAGLRGFFGPVLRQLAPHARLLVLAPDPADAGSAEAAAVARAIEGFVRSLAKEVGRLAATANALQLPRWADGQAADRLLGPLRFFCSRRSAYVSGRVLALSAALPGGVAEPLAAPRLAGRLALVTGAARGLGAATAERLAEEGARVLCVDVPAAAEPLQALARRLNGEALTLDISTAQAPAALCDWLCAQGRGLDVLVHNAGITRDRTLLKMSEAEWQQVMAVNLQAILSIDAALDAGGLLNEGGREICLSSISGIAGNLGQTNYATSKAALIGYVAARAALLAPRGISVNAVAPGFIETEMTRRIPLLIREAGRRMNALAQGGQPRDVAEAVAFLALPESLGVTGQTLRVCGQALLGA
ncbi:3-oxoacyl-ACP reductase [Paucibacter sp. APW11]|uniref:3-oxoacyl-ACP reductase n=1 Tax=Roseateles aquae TaxID=3077235 RepID=A0ABU3PG60_9BURK|nr:3-oxoacyl-ACP reductase [Paucibacter sp. APW11]MDT9001147.1 3-oxoacyl-ACP reductase [Paucibacter sp. APW11]